jgi:hypothetical protein
MHRVPKLVRIGFDRLIPFALAHGRWSTTSRGSAGCGIWTMKNEKHAM